MYFKIIFICSFFHSNKMANHGFPFILIFVALTVRLILAMPYVESEVRLFILKLFYNEQVLYAGWYVRVDILNFQQFKLKFDIQNLEFKCKLFKKD